MEFFHFAASIFGPEFQSDMINDFFGTINGAIASLFFFDVLFFVDGITLPLTVAWLVIGAVFFTLYFGFFNFRGFKHALDIVRGKYDKPENILDVIMNSFLNRTNGHIHSVHHVHRLLEFSVCQ